MRRLLIAVFAVFALFQVGLGAKAALAQSIEITNEVWGSYQEYLGRIGVTNPGAFAVSGDGGSSYYFYCGDPVCRSGTTYRHEALRRCEDMTGRDCVIFALRREIQLAYTIEPRTTTTTTAATTPSAPYVPEPEEPPFESPLADGTIVLSRKVARELDAYLAGLDRQGILAFFYVAPDGRDAGAYACDGNGTSGLPLCPMKPMSAWADPKPDPTKVKQRALDLCQADSDAGGCVMLYSADSRRQEYKIVE